MHLLLSKGVLGIFDFLVPPRLPFAHLFLQVHILGASIGLLRRESGHQLVELSHGEVFLAQLRLKVLQLLLQG